MDQVPECWEDVVDQPEPVIKTLDMTREFISARQKKAKKREMMKHYYYHKRFDHRVKYDQIRQAYCDEYNKIGADSLNAFINVVYYQNIFAKYAGGLIMHPRECEKLRALYGTEQRMDGEDVIEYTARVLSGFASELLQNPHRQNRQH